MGEKGNCTASQKQMKDFISILMALYFISKGLLTNLLSIFLFGALLKWSSNPSFFTHSHTGKLTRLSNFVLLLVNSKNGVHFVGRHRLNKAGCKCGSRFKMNLVPMYAI